jgi:hypothetical protein
LRKKIAWDYLNFVAGYSILFGLTTLLFKEEDDEHPVINFDPRTSDFGKVRVGNTRMDVTSGLSNAAVFMTRMALAQTTNHRGEVKDLRVIGDGGNMRYGQYDSWDVASNFFRSKLAPIPASIINVQQGQNVVGENYAAGAKFMEEYMNIPPDLANSRWGAVVQELAGYAVPLSVQDFVDAAEEHGVPKAVALQTVATLGVSMNTYDVNKKEGRSRKRPTRTRPKRQSTN